MMDDTLLVNVATQAPGLVLVVYVVKLFLSYISKTREEDRGFIKELSDASNQIHERVVRSIDTNNVLLGRVERAVDHVLPKKES